MQVVRGAVAMLDGAGADDDVGIVGVEHRGVIAACGQWQGDVSACQCAQIAHQGGEVVARVDE